MLNNLSEFTFQCSPVPLPTPHGKSRISLLWGGGKEIPTLMAGLGDLLIFLSEFIPGESCTCLRVPTHPMQSCFLPCHLTPCLAQITVCPTSPLSSVIHCQVINHQCSKYLAGQKCESTSTPNGNWMRDFQVEWHAGGCKVTASQCQNPSDTLSALNFR